MTAPPPMPLCFQVQAGNLSLIYSFIEATPVAACGPKASSSENLTGAKCPDVGTFDSAGQNGSRRSKSPDARAFENVGRSTICPTAKTETPRFSKGQTFGDLPARLHPTMLVAAHIHNFEQHGHWLDYCIA